jgi:hypothetical protein
MPKRKHYKVQITPHKSIDGRVIAVETNNRFSAARAGWLWLGQNFGADITVMNLKGRIIYRTAFSTIGRD